MKTQKTDKWVAKIVMAAGLLLLSLTGVSCGGMQVGSGSSSGDSSGSGSGAGQAISVATVLTSSSLSENEEADPSFLKYSLSDDCQGYANCITPSNISGKIYYSGIMVGNETGYSLGPIVGTVQDPSPTLSFDMAELYDFDFANALSVSGGFTCCEGSPYPADSDAIAVRIESYFAYVDISFTLTEADGVSAELAGAHTIRTVYADINDTEYQQGDFLYEVTSGDFRWCTLADGCVHSSRPADPLQYAEVTNFAGTPDGQGNQVIPTFAVQINPDSQISLTESEVLANSWEFTIDFDMGDGVIFTQPLSEIGSIAELVSVVQLAAEPGNSQSSFSADLSAVKTPLETETETASADLTICADADLGSALGSSLYSGTNSGAVNDIEPICGGSALGEDILFVWEAPADGRYVIRWHGAYDPILYVLDSCPESALDVAGLTQDCDAPSPSEADVVTDELIAGQTIIIGVDGRTNGTNGSSGAFTLDVVESVCGDGVCRTGEDYLSCYADCH